MHSLWYQSRQQQQPTYYSRPISSGQLTLTIYLEQQQLIPNHKSRTEQQQAAQQFPTGTAGTSTIPVQTVSTTGHHHPREPQQQQGTELLIGNPTEPQLQSGLAFVRPVQAAVGAYLIRPTLPGPVCIVEKYWTTEPTKNGSYITDDPFSATHDPFYRTKGQGVPYSN